MLDLDKNIRDILNSKVLELERYFESDVAFYYGLIHPAYLKNYRDFIEQLKYRDANDQRERLTILLNTMGGSAESAEKMVHITRHHYNEVYFVIPDYALSAGTIFCMSGDKIYMDYSSSLGPIDPQLDKGDKYVPALGYLDKVEEMLEKSRQGTLTNPEFIMLQNLDLAELRSYEQAKDLTITLLKEWLVKYKFKNWTHHGSNPDKLGQEVTLEEKEERAKEIADLLSNNKNWHSHNRFIGINVLQNTLRLRIDDYSNNTALRSLIRSYNDLICEYIIRSGFEIFMHHRHYF